MNTKQTYNRPVLFAALALLTLSSAAAASGQAASMERSVSPYTAARMLPCNPSANQEIASSDRTSVVGFGETDPANHGAFTESAVLPVEVAWTSGSTVGFAESDPAGMADRDGAATIYPPDTRDHVAMREQHHGASPQQSVHGVTVQSGCES